MNSVCLGCIGCYVTFVVRLTPLRHHNDVKITECPKSKSLCIVMDAAFKIKHWKSKGMKEKRIKHECSVWIENSAPRDDMTNSDPWGGIFCPLLTPMLKF